MDTHKRDGSLIRKKQEQWARERAEGSKGVWFPFGSPGGGTPNRKFEAIDYRVPPKIQQVSLSQGSSTAYGNNDATLPRSTSQSQLDDGAKVTNVDKKHYQPECLHRPTALPSQLLPTHQHPPLHSPTATCPFPVPASAFPMASAPMTVPWGYLQPVPISIIPPGTVPIPIQDPSMSVAEGKPKCHVSAAEQLAQVNPTNFCWASMTPNPVPVAIPIPTPVTINNAPVDPCQEPRDSPTFTPPQRSTYEAYDSSVSTSHDSIPVTTNSNMSKHERDQRRTAVDYGEQIAEKKRIEAEEAERNRCEEEKIVREREAQIRREEEEQRRHLEAEYLREQEKERVRKVLEEALERAKHEAEITRKAKVYKHVLEGADKTPELERRLLGVDPETGDRILQEINQLERHKKLDREAIDKMSPKLDGTGQREKSPNQRRSKLNTSARSQSRQTISEAEMMSVAGNDGGKTSPRRKQIASAHQFVLADDHPIRRVNEFSGVHQTLSSNNASTPFRRTDVGRMSVRVTRKEKENATVGNFRESSAQALNRSPDFTVNWPVQDHRTPLSKIPTGTTPPSRTAICGGRSSSSLLHRPLKSVNHQPTVESEAARLIKSLPEDISTSRRPISSEEFCDNPLFSPVVTRHRRPNRMRGTTNSPVSVESAEGSNGSTEGTSGGSSSESASPKGTAPSPIPSVVVSHDPFTVTKSIPTLNNNELKIRRALAASPAYLNQTPQSNSRFSKRLAEKGCKKTEDLLSIEVRRKAEAGLSHASSMQSIRGSIGNLSVGWRGSVSNLTEESPYLSRFRSTDPKFRSFSAKTTEKQKEVIDRLSRLRESLRSKESFTERDPHSKNRSDVDDINTRIQSTVIFSSS